MSETSKLFLSANQPATVSHVHVGLYADCRVWDCL